MVVGIVGFNRRTNIKIIPYDEDILSELIPSSSTSKISITSSVTTSSSDSCSSLSLDLPTPSSSSSLSSLNSSNIIQNITINYSHNDLQILKNNLEIAIRIRPQDPKFKIHYVFIKSQKQYLLLTPQNFQEIIHNILDQETKIFMKIIVTESNSQRIFNQQKKKLLEKQFSTIASVTETIAPTTTVSTPLPIAALANAGGAISATPKSSSRATPVLKKKLSADDVLKPSRKKISSDEISKDRRRSSTLENCSVTSLDQKKFPHTPRRRSMTSLNDENTNSTSLITPSTSSSVRAAAAGPAGTGPGPVPVPVTQNEIKCVVDRTKLAPKSGKLFRGGSNNIPKFDLPPPPQPDSHLSKENVALGEEGRAVTDVISPRLSPLPPPPSPLETQESTSPSSLSPSISASAKKKRRVVLQESNPNICQSKDQSQHPQKKKCSVNEESSSSSSSQAASDSGMEAKMRRISC